MTAPVPFFQVDAFAQRPFTGNPAAVCRLPRWPEERWLLAVAAENNLSETAYVVGPDADGAFDLRWFTPRVEVDLCGHGTLAAAHVLIHEEGRGERVRFSSRSGPLRVERRGEGYELDLPARPPEAVDRVQAVATALGRRPLATVRARDLVARLPRAEDVRGLAPDLAAVRALGRALCVTAPGTGPDADVDFVSRYFAPAEGIPEDPVTGSAHCTLAPLWARKLGKTKLRARQVGPRGGELTCRLDGARVWVGGRAVTVIRGELHAPP